jgi:hypothetical protein
MRMHEPAYVPRVVVKFEDAVQLPYDGSVAPHLDRLTHGAWQRLAQLVPGITIRPLTNSIAAARLRELSALGARLDTSYRPPNLLTYFAIDCPEPKNIAVILKELKNWPQVQAAYFDPPGEDPVITGDDPRLPRQGYLDPAPNGIDAKYAWGRQGGDGSGQKFVDLEKGWTLVHEDLAPLYPQKLFGDVVDTSRPHGTSVLGVVFAASNDVGGRGIASALSTASVVSYAGNLNSVPNVIDVAIDALGPGGVLLLEVQKDSLPTELNLADFDRIRLATAIGITVVECAGNGGFDLDNVKDENGQYVLNPSDRNFRDSGAVLVGAASSASPHVRMSFSNYGQRLNCYAWGENVDTASSTKILPFTVDAYTRTFNGTSSAAAIIAGAALAVQGMATIGLGRTLTGREMRTTLGNPATGTSAQPPGMNAVAGQSAEPIGVMPDLRAIVNSGALGIVPVTVPHQR